MFKVTSVLVQAANRFMIFFFFSSRPLVREEQSKVFNLLFAGRLMEPTKTRLVDQPTQDGH